MSREGSDHGLLPDGDEEATEVRSPSFKEPFVRSPSLVPQSERAMGPRIAVPAVTAGPRPMQSSLAWGEVPPDAAELFPRNPQPSTEEDRLPSFAEDGLGEPTERRLPSFDQVPSGPVEETERRLPSFDDAPSEPRLPSFDDAPPAAAEPPLPSFDQTPTFGAPRAEEPRGAARALGSAPTLNAPLSLDSAPGLDQLVSSARPGPPVASFPAPTPPAFSAQPAPAPAASSAQPAPAPPVFAAQAEPVAPAPAPQMPAIPDLAHFRSPFDEPVLRASGEHPEPLAAQATPHPHPVAPVHADAEAPAPPSLATYAVVFLSTLSIVVCVGLLVHRFVLQRPAEAVPSGGETATESSPPVPPPETTATTAVASTAAPKPPAPQPTTEPTTEPSAEATAAPAARPAAAEGAEDQTRAALENLKAGVKRCVEEHIGVLPGTSKPVPASFNMFRGGTYTSPKFVWNAPVFHCTKFSVEGPQPFIIQWQSERPTTTGQGVAWLDDDGDGKADRSLSFPAKLVKRNVVELGEVVVDPQLREIKRP